MKRIHRIALMIACVAAPLTLAAQEVSWRIVAGPTGELRPNGYWGAEVREELGDGSETVGSNGVRHRTPPKFLASAMGLVGMTDNKDIRGDHMLSTTAQAQVGVLYRATSNMRIGAYAAAVAVPESYGALARVEPLSSIAVQLGVLRRRDTNVNGGVFQIDIALAFIEDLLHGGSR